MSHTFVVERQIELDGSVSENKIKVKVPVLEKEGCAPAGGCEPLDRGQNGISEHETISRTTGVTVRVFAGELQISYPKNVQHAKRSVPERKAGDIKQFSRKSRMRMMRMYNRIQHIKMSSPLFITLTARPECFERKAEIVPEQYRDQVHSYLFRKFFIPAMKKIIPGFVYVWKMEPHRSGQAHYHLIVWSEKSGFNIDSEYYKRQIRGCWRAIIDDESRSAELFSCKIHSIKNERQVFAYMSKYVMKVEEGKTANIAGRRWGKSSNLPVSPILEFGLRMDMYERLKEICKEIIKRRKRNNEYYLDQIDSGADWFIWLDSETIINMLRRSNRFGEATKYERFMRTGGTDPGVDELADLAAEFGIDF